MNSLWPIVNRLPLSPAMSSLAIGTTSIIGKIVTNLVTRGCVQVMGRDQIAKLYNPHRKKRPTISLGNHESVVDEPLVWALVLSLSQVYGDPEFHRYTLTAQEICFSNLFNSLFFSLCRGIAVQRGCGLYQPGVDRAIELCRDNHWIHIFPEGRVVQEDRMASFKWGTARIIAESTIVDPAQSRVISTPDIFGVYLRGLRRIAPLNQPFRFLENFGKPIEIAFGGNFDVGDLILKHVKKYPDGIIARRTVPREDHSIPWFDSVTQVLDKEDKEDKEKASSLFTPLSVSAPHPTWQYHRVSEEERELYAAITAQLERRMALLEEECLHNKFSGD
mmetsp:Transcript_27476/g.76790  ORF Transcript_27476/g.76790 Transcript_27476/m.76790 type:complete len:333 (+) Transcript_27476:77-1075(+)